MLADEISHDLLAAIIGGIGLIIVATVPLLWRAVGERRKARIDLIVLRERIAELERMLNEGQERRSHEHQEILERLEDVIGMIARHQDFGPHGR